MVVRGGIIKFNYLIIYGEVSRGGLVGSNVIAILHRTPCRADVEGDNDRDRFEHRPRPHRQSKRGRRDVKLLHL